MVKIEVEHDPPPRVVDAPDNDQRNEVSTYGETSATGEPEEYDMFSATDEDVEDEGNGRAHHRRLDTSTPNATLETDEEVMSSTKRNSQETDLFYDENLDEEDEAYVYKHMRGGIRENVTVNITSDKDAAIGGKDCDDDNGINDITSDSDNEQRKALRKQMVQMYKPRHSDAVLSCPCCFNIVCMDCQKHKRYANQYRAMFVMGVVVDWKHILVYDETHRALVSKIEHHPNAIEEEEENSNEWQLAETNGEFSLASNNNGILRAKKGEYYAVECAACRTQVAALDMTDEVYYFHGCLESSSAF